MDFILLRSILLQWSVLWFWQCSLLMECCLKCQVIRMRETLQRFQKNKLVPFNEKLSGQHYSFSVRDFSTWHACWLWDLISCIYTKMALSSVLWCCCLGGRKGIRPVKNWWGAGVVICLERGADLHMVQLMPLPLTVSCFSKIQTRFTFLVPACLGSPGKRAIKRVCVCLCCAVDQSHGVHAGGCVHKILQLAVKTITAAHHETDVIRA